MSSIKGNPKKHPVALMKERIDEVIEVDKLIRQGKYLEALVLTQKYKFIPTRELKRALS